MASDLRPALIGSAALHLSLLAATLIVWPHFAKPLPTAPVAVKLVATAPVTDVRPAIEAPEPAPATAPEPAPETRAETTPVPPPPEPTPAPPPPKPPPPTPAPPAPEPPKPPSLDLDKLASKLPKPKLDLNKLARSEPQPKLDLNRLAASRPQARLDLNKLAARAPKGPLRPETAAQAREAAGAAQGLTADEASLLAAKLRRLWNPNCGAEGASNVQVRVDIRLSPNGGLAAPPAVVGGQSNDPVWQAAAQRALSAVARGAPYDELPRDRYTVWKDIVFNFNGREACAGR